MVLFSYMRFNFTVVYIFLREKHEFLIISGELIAKR